VSYELADHAEAVRFHVLLHRRAYISDRVADARLLEDKWTAVTEDGSFSAHFEHCVAVTKDGPVILTQ